MTSPSSNTNDQANVSVATKIFAEYGGFIYGVIRYKVKDKALVDDLYQDFFLSLVSNPIPSSVRNIKSYLYRAVKNDIIDAGRKIERYRNLKNYYANNYPINKDSSKNAFINEERANEIFKLIGGKLTPSEARAITLRYKNDCSIKEVAQKMDVKKESVSRYICTGLNKIRRFLNVKRGSQNDGF
ncbi:MAG: RNA polymerase sigma factor [Planctomycetota bacterium]|jgi:RNA polymerase sigma factor (sigma-70 family)